MNTKALAKLTNARTALLLDHYFFGRLGLYLKLVENTSLPTLAVDGKHIFYNPEFILSLPNDLVRSAIVHEISHCIFDHQSRRCGRDPKTWNKAGDYAIHDMMTKAKFKIGDGWLYEPSFAGMSAEHIYDIIKQDESEGKKHDDGLCDIQDGGDSQAEIAEQQVEWKIAVNQAAFSAKQMGKVPAGMERFIKDLGETKVPWRQVLHRFVSEITKDDYSWMRPNRKLIAHELVLPGLRSESMGPIEIVIDTSGSIDQPTLNAFGAEIEAIVSAVRPLKTTVTYCDAAVNHVDVFMPGDTLAFKMHGGGGTDFRPPFAAIEERGENPVALIYLTDLYGPHGEQPDYPVLWVCTNNTTAPWGETLHIEV